MFMLKVDYYITITNAYTLPYLTRIFLKLLNWSHIVLQIRTYYGSLIIFYNTNIVNGFVSDF